MLESLFAEPKILALGVASCPAGDRDPDGPARDAAPRAVALAGPVSVRDHAAGRGSGRVDKLSKGAGTFHRP